MDIKIIYGPPGTGKTTTLLNIVNKELNDGVPMNRLAYVAFSKKAATEVQFRLQSYGIDAAAMPHCRTIHSMCFRDTHASRGQMMNPSRYKDFGSKAGYSLKGYCNVEEGYEGKDDDYIGLDQLYRNTPKAAEVQLEDVNRRRFINFLALYRKYKDTFKYTDFTDLVENYIAGKMECDVDVAIVDEAQDLTSLQWQFVFQAFKNCKRLYIAGDDDQCIYSWSGADVNAFINLKGTAQILDKSYRLPQQLVSKANRLIRMCSKRVDKRYTGLSTDERTGYSTKINNIQELEINTDDTYYILARNNFLVKELQEEFISRGEPFLVKGEPYLSPSEVFSFRDQKDVRGWDPMKIQYANKLVDQNRLFEEPRINLGTIHSVKGGEADHVVLLTDMSRASYRQLDKDPDSEHRVFYVGMTRAKKGLTVVLPQTRFSYSPILRW